MRRGDPARPDFDIPVWIQKAQMDWTGDNQHVWWGKAGQREGVSEYERLERGGSCLRRGPKDGSEHDGRKEERAGWPASHATSSPTNQGERSQVQGPRAGRG